MIVVKLKKVNNTGNELQFPIEYVTQTGKVVKDYNSLKFPEYNGKDVYEGPSRKAILLTRLVNLTKWLIRDHRQSVKTNQPLKTSINLQTGIKIPPPLTEEQQQIDSDLSLTLGNISSEYLNLLNIFLEHYKREVEVIQDQALLQEIQMLEDLIDSIKRTDYRINQAPSYSVAHKKTPTSTTSDTSHSDDYLITIRNHIIQLPQKESLPDPSNTVEVCFVMDCTGSMGAYIKMCQEKINQIVDIITKDNPNSEIKIAFVGYRDHNEAPGGVLSFSNNVNEVKTFISKVTASGGNDIPEDVCGGLKDAVNLKWTSPHRLLILIADAPCHGSMYHKERDDYPRGDPKGLIPEVLLTQAARKNISLFFARINARTDKMTDLWQKHLLAEDSAFPLTLFSIIDDSDFIANITDAITTVLFHSDE